MKAVSIIAYLIIFWAYTSDAQQMNDSLFNTTVARPAYKNQGPRVLIDAAHFNLFSTTTDRIEPLDKLLQADGYKVDLTKSRFTKNLLSNHKILIILTAIGGPSQSDSTYLSAFNDSEIQVLYDWIKTGGSLLFAIDHSPYNYAAEKLLKRLGVAIAFGGIEDSIHSEAGVEKGPDGRRATLVFTKENRLLGDHPIINGRNSNELVSKVAVFGGQSIKGPKGSSVLLKLSPTAYNTGAGTVASYRQPIGNYNAAAVAFPLGAGRVVVTSDCSMWTAQFVTLNERWIEFGMARRDLDNRQFALNVMHWLSHSIN